MKIQCENCKEIFQDKNITLVTGLEVGVWDDKRMYLCNNCFKERIYGKR